MIPTVPSELLYPPFPLITPAKVLSPPKVWAAFVTTPAKLVVAPAIASSAPVEELILTVVGFSTTVISVAPPPPVSPHHAAFV